MRIAMHLTRRTVIKWSFITAVCGGQSFFWGLFVTKQLTIAIAAMLLAMVTVMLGFATIDSHPRYQAKRAANALLAKALDWGVKIRFFYSFLIFTTMIGWSNPPAGFVVLISMDMSIGAVAMATTNSLTGSDIERASREAHSMLEYFFAIYCTSIITALIHTVVLALLCGLLYGMLYMYKKIRNLHAH